MSARLTEHPYAGLLAGVSKPSRYLGGEHNQVVKDARSVDARLVLAFPDVCEIGSSHLGTKILYALVNREPRLACERAFTPWPDMEQALRRARLPLLSLETATPLREFDVVGISLQYELTYTNILTLLDLGGIPLRAAQRAEADPLVLGGGPAATHPEPIAPFFDAFFIGEAEAELPALLRDWVAWRRQGASRSERLLRLAERGFIYVPTLYETQIEERTGLMVVGAPRDPRVPPRPRRTWVEEIDAYPFPSDSPVPHAEAVFDRQGVEMARGCTEGCRFCQAGMIYRPVRERRPGAIIDSLLGGIENGGYDQTALTALSTADYSAIQPLLARVIAELAERKVTLAVASLRAYGLPRDILDGLRQLRARGLTFAPEAGTQRMRDVVCKNVTEAHLLETAEQVFSRGWNRMKLYFMVGLPTEEAEDLRGIIDTARRAREVGLRLAPGGRVEITVAVSCHVPKPHTPFQWCAMDTLPQIEEKRRMLWRWAREAKVKLKTHDPRASWLEGIFCRGDRRLADVLEHAWRNGCRFDGWNEQLHVDTWLAAFRERGVDTERFLTTFPVAGRLPWDHIDVGIEAKFLRTEYQRALRGRTSPPCGKVAGQLLHHGNLKEALAESGKLVCYRCGVACDMTKMREERLEILRELGATIRPSVGSASAAAGAGQSVARPRARPLPPVAFDGVHATAHRFRVLFEKRGVAAVTGHLDLARLIARAIRRAGLMPTYSRGFRPRPHMSFGPALGLGIESAGEVVDISVTDDLPASELASRLAAASAQGIRFLRAVRLREGDPGLGRVIRYADFSARLATPIVLTPSSLLGRPSFVVERHRTRKRSVRSLDIVPFMVSAEQRDPRTVCWRVACGPNGSARPAEVLRALFATSGVPEEARPAARLEREALWAATAAGELVSPLELAKLRPNGGPPRPSTSRNSEQDSQVFSENY